MDKQYVLKYDKNNKRETIKVKYLFDLFCLAVIICSISSKIKLFPCCIENTSNIVSANVAQIIEFFRDSLRSAFRLSTAN